MRIEADTLETVGSVMRMHDRLKSVTQENRLKPVLRESDGFVLVRGPKAHTGRLKSVTQEHRLKPVLRKAPDGRHRT